MLFKRILGGLLTGCLLLVCFPGAAAAEGVGTLSSLSAVLLEPTSGRVLYEKDAHTPRPMASTTKLMTALLAVENVDPDAEVVVEPAAVRVEGSALGLRGGDHITMRDLVTGLLLVSGNDAANAVAYAVAGDIPSFAAKMNARAAEIGMKDTTFVTPSGLDEGEHSSSAYDMALLGAEVLKHPLLADICATKSAVIEFGNPKRKVTVSNHNRLLKLYEYAVGMKTGFTKKSGRCLVSAAQKDGVTLVAVTLNGGDYWNDHMALYEYGFSQTEAFPLPAPTLPPLPVTGGTAGETALQMDQPPTVTLLTGEAERVQAIVELPRFAWAPVAAGDRVGTVRYVLDDRELCALPITAAAPVEARPVAGFGERFWRYLGALLDVLLAGT